ncbi:MAG: metalloregulator ArsR/SmtB family transcription factor [Spirochaetaceae bacterium]|jgi:ArsR family transcriptional regulator|nr:metalloregulator ArsR/SmtB family transcription factor [Spirochaetaceae bacterium]
MAFNENSRQDGKTVSNRAAVLPAAEFCESVVIHDDVVREVAVKMPDEELLFDLSDLFKMFADSTRIKIIAALLNAPESTGGLGVLCVCDIAALLGMTVSAISHQLRLLRQSKLVKYRREGKIVYYSLDDDHVRDILKLGLAHLEE